MLDSRRSCFPFYSQMLLFSFIWRYVYHTYVPVCGMKTYSANLSIILSRIINIVHFSLQPSFFVLNIRIWSIVKPLFTYWFVSFNWALRNLGIRMTHHYLVFPKYSLNFRTSNLIVLFVLLCPPLGMADISPWT